jgi:hypothetical protein
MTADFCITNLGTPCIMRRSLRTQFSSVLRHFTSPAFQCIVQEFVAKHSDTPVPSPFRHKSSSNSQCKIIITYLIFSTFKQYHHHHHHHPHYRRRRQQTTNNSSYCYNDYADDESDNKTVIRTKSITSQLRRNFHLLWKPNV